MIESNILGIDNGAMLLIAMYAIACTIWLIKAKVKK